MELTDVLQQCPKAAQKYFQFSGNALRELQKRFLEEVPEGVENSEVPEIGEEISQEYGRAVLLTNTRSLYDFFDQEKVVITVAEDESRDFYYSISPVKEGDENFISEKNYPNRIETEIEAFSHAFQKLEGQLNEKDS